MCLWRRSLSWPLSLLRPTCNWITSRMYRPTKAGGSYPKQSRTIFQKKRPELRRKRAGRDPPSNRLPYAAAGSEETSREKAQAREGRGWKSLPHHACLPSLFPTQEKVERTQGHPCASCSWTVPDPQFPFPKLVASLCRKEHSGSTAEPTQLVLSTFSINGSL